MKNSKKLMAGALYSASTLTACSFAAEKPMNVIFILADDLGWADTTLYGKTHLYETPNLDRLAQRGVTFTQAYAASPLCSPTRASILTGQTPARNGSTAPWHHTGDLRLTAVPAESAGAGSKTIDTLSATRLDTKFPTLGKMIKGGGYSTAHFGKWHLGPEPYSPLQHGFDVDIPHWPGPGPAGSFVAPWAFPKFKANYQREHLEDRMASEAVKWMGSLPENKPFFMNYWMFSVHAPFDAKEELIELYTKKIDPKDPQRSSTYAAMVHSMDDAVGRLLDEVDRLGIADRTAIIFISDNGGNMYNGIENYDGEGTMSISPPTSNAPLRGGKASVYEGGIRVPCVIVWPGVTKPGIRSDAIIQTTDFYPTILNLLGIPLPPDHVVDGVDITSALRGEKFNRPSGLITYFPFGTPVPEWLPPSMSIRVGDWKLIRLFYQGENGAHDYRLYNLKDDLSEQNNLAGSYPEKVVEMDRMIEKYIESARPVLPRPNPNFDPAQYHPERIGIQPGGLSVQKSMRARSTPPKGAEQAGNWKIKKQGGVGLTINDGILVIDFNGEDPWIYTDDLNVAGLTGSVTLDLEILTEQSGTLQVFCGWNGRGFVAKSDIKRAVPAVKEWVPVSVVLPVKGTLTSLRIDPPGSAGKTQLRNIHLKDSSGQVLKSWF